MALVGAGLACGATRAEAQVHAVGAAPVGYRHAYDVRIVNDHGSTLDMFAKAGRYYVRGEQGERYAVVVRNPTHRRVEAVVTVDGLDVIDGEAGSLAKRGYIIEPYGEVKIEGFRTSVQNVATFRFASVAASYAGRKGQARNVGVIAVAVFEQAAPPPRPRPSYRIPWPSRREAPGYDDGAAEKAPRSSAAPSSAPRAPSASGQGRAGAADAEASAVADKSEQARDQDENRPGLGTEFGEGRWSQVSYTKFVRASQRPSGITELRYNDTDGLAALGIYPQPPYHDEAYARETANPFPADRRFARPPE